MQRQEGPEFEDFVSAAWPRLFRTAHALTGSRTDADDLLQGALVRTFTSWSRVRRAGNPEAYVHRIIVNESVSAWRRRWRHSERPTAHLPETAAVGDDERATTHGVVWQALQRLPPRQRAVVVLRYYEDLTERDVADAMGITPGAVKSQAHAALRSMRAHLEQATALAHEETP